MPILIPFIFIYLAIVCLFTGWTDSSLDFILTYIKGVPVNVPIGISFLIMLCLGPVALAFNTIVTLLYYII